MTGPVQLKSENFLYDQDFCGPSIPVFEVLFRFQNYSENLVNFIPSKYLQKYSAHGYVYRPLSFIHKGAHRGGSSS